MSYLNQIFGDVSGVASTAIRQFNSAANPVYISGIGGPELESAAVSQPSLDNGFNLG